MQFTNVSSPKWANQEHTAIDCIVNFSALGEVPFTASADGDYPYTHEIFERCLAGEYGQIAEFEPVFIPAPEILQIAPVDKLKMFLADNPDVVALLKG